MESSPSRGRVAALTTAGILVAVALVAVASRGATSAGSGGARRPADTLLDVMLSLYVVLLVAGAALFLYLLALGRHAAGHGARSRRDWRTWVGLTVLAGALILLANDLPNRRLSPGVAVPESAGGTAQTERAPGSNTYEPDFAWVAVLVTLAVLGLAVGAWLWSGRARRRARGERLWNPLSEELVVALDLSLDDLRAEPDSRRAVVAAYARLEQVLAAHGVPRRPSEAPLEYLARLLAELDVGDRAARRLTRLFERAKFSQHAVGPEMKEEAIAALVRVRDDLLAAQALAAQAHEAARAAR